MELDAAAKVERVRELVVRQLPAGGERRDVLAVLVEDERVRNQLRDRVAVDVAVLLRVGLGTGCSRRREDQARLRACQRH